MSTTLLEKEIVILNRQEIIDKGNELLKSIKEKLDNIDIDEDSINSYITEVAGVDYFFAEINMDNNNNIFYIDQVIDERPKVIILNTTTDDLVMFNIDDVESMVKYISHRDKSKLYHTKLEKEYDPFDFTFTKNASISEEASKNFGLLNTYLEKNTIVKTPDERIAALGMVEEVKDNGLVNPISWGEPVPLDDIIKNASSALSQATIQRNVLMDNTQIIANINPMEASMHPDDNTEAEDIDEESKMIYDRYMYAPSALIPDPRNPDLSIPAIKAAMDDRRKRALQEIDKYKKSMGVGDKKTPLSNKRI